MQHDPIPARAPHATAGDVAEPVGRDDSSSTSAANTKQPALDEREKRTHEQTENELPSTQEKNPVPPNSCVHDTPRVGLPPAGRQS